ncbi:superoxide dismutase [Cohnella massiliensis]|uniref:superoxide dismutase n=1 Tax=Cohnella massiliensis TaxID=1816691 RepID=UPI0009BB990E|nr:superoxide dismutase [Cohnella massiliensis]
MPTAEASGGYPFELANELVGWKTRESQGTLLLRERIPGLEPAFAKLLNEWQLVFERTAAAARYSLYEPTPGTPFHLSRRASSFARLEEEAKRQSAEYIRHLKVIRKNSEAFRKNPEASALAERLQAESGRYLDASEPKPAASSAPAGQIRPNGEESDDAAERPDIPQPADGLARSPEGSWSDPLPGVGTGRPVPIGGHSLPPLPYPYDALEPYIDEKTMRIHHDKHHQSYVDGLNKAELKLQEARRTGDFDLVKHWERELAFHGAGHYLHTIFWDAMSPKGGGKPTGPLAEQIERDFGGYEAFKRQFTEAADKVEGGGWAILVWSPRARRLEILTAEKHQNLSQWDVVPLLPLDVWEHAYYLKHQNDRAGYIKDWWNVVNWPYVSDRFAKARTLQWQPY